jgi:cellulose biosynthesis protein BcsQ
MVTALQNDLDWIITDCDRDEVPNGADLVLVVCGPEPRSVMNAAAFRGLGRGPGHESNCIFLLNNFDASSEQHCRMRERLAAEAGSTLLPFAISKADELSEALLDGKTIFEFAPDAAACAEFSRLACWLGNHLTTQSTQDRKAA